MNLLDRAKCEKWRPLRVPRGLWVAMLMLAAALFVTIPALAQTGNSVVTGRVTDAASNAAVADVVVTATSPALQGEQIVVTDASGSFRIPNLPPGDYTLRLEKETYKPYSRGGITLRVSTTIRVNAALLPEALKAEEIVVVGRAPTVDVGSSSTGQNINQDFTRRIAVAPPAGKGGAQRSFESVAEVAPGAHTDQYGTSVNGTTSPENGYVIDGLSVNDPAYGIVGTPLSVEFVKEVNVVSGGYMPEYGRSTGGVLEVVTKTGSNEFHGSVFFNYTPGLLEGTRELVIREGSTIATEQELIGIRDFGFEIGGPVLKDKLWFFAGFDVALTSRGITRYLNYIPEFDPMTNEPLLDERGFTIVERVPGSEREYIGTQQTIQYIGKLTYQINQDHSLSLSIYGSPSSSGGSGALGIDPQDGGLETVSFAGAYSALAHEYVSSSNDIALKYSAAFNNKRLLLDFTLGWHHQDSSRLPSDDSEIASGEGLSAVPSVSWRRNNPTNRSIDFFEPLPAGAEDLCRERQGADLDGDGVGDTLVPCPVATYLSGGPDFIDDASLDRVQLKVVGTSLFEGLGHHVVKGGLDGELMSYDHTKAYSGRERFRENLSGTTLSDNRMYGFLTGPEVGDYVIQDQVVASSLSTTIGGFVQDSWSIMDKVTLNIGVRYDAQYLIGDDGKIGMALPNQWSPRVGVVYDFTQQGRSKIFANYARYYESVPLDVVDRQFGDERQLTSVRRSHPDLGGSGTCDPRDPQQANGPECQDDANRLQVGGPYDPNAFWIPTAGGKTPIDPDISPQSSDEIVVGGEYEILPNGRLGVSYTKRWMNNVIEDMSRDEATTYFIGNPGKGIASDFPEAERDYDAVTFYFQKAFTDLWLAQASYTISYLRGNYAGLFRPENGQLDPNINSDFDLVSLLPNRSGALPADRTHEIKIFGAKAFEIPGDMVLDLGLTFRTRSGSPSDYWGSHPLYGADEVFILPRGSGERTPWVHNIDFHFGYAFGLAKDSQLILSVDIFNLFNWQEVTQTDNRYTNADVLPCIEGTVDTLEPADPATPSCLKYVDGSDFDPADKNKNFGNPQTYQAPRTVRLGARVTF